jgi:Skp family chaperone for outer membrane proteins
MARVNFVKSARKDYPEHNIKKGESYYWWKFNFSKVRHMSKTSPKRSQLTQSSFLSSLYDIEDRIAELKADTLEDLQADVESIKEEIESLRDEVQDHLDSMPDQLRETSSAGETLQDRMDNLESWISEFDSLDMEPSEYEEANEERKKEIIQELIEEVQATSSGL